MKVLITGGYGFIGSHVVERFYAEGHQVYIIDNLSTGNIKNVTCKHKFFKLDVEDSRCEEVFKSNKFDVVVHLAAQINVVTSIDNPYIDTKSNILGITNMLNLSSKYGVRKFIFASSAAVYGDNSEIPLKEDSKCNPLSPYGMSKLTGELYCKKWNEIYGLDTVCFRFSNVYGPRQGTIGEGGVVSIYLERMFDDKELIVFGDGNQTRDFIYVEDLAEAIYKSTRGKISGVVNLSTNTENSVNRLVEILGGFKKLKGVVYKEPRKGDIYRSCMDNTTVSKRLNWKPRFSFEEGLKKTYDWYSEYHKEKPSQPVEKKSSRDFTFIKKVLPYIENFALFAAVFLINQFYSRHSTNVMIDVGIVYIIITAIMYGTKQATISVVLTSFLYLFNVYNSGRDIVSMVYDVNILVQIAIYIVVGMVVGYSLDRKNLEINSKTMENEAIEEKNRFITKMYEEIQQQNIELQNQIINSEDSFGKIFSIVKQLESLNPDKVFTSSVSVLENILKSDSIAIYVLSSSKKYLRLESSSSKIGNDIPRSVKIDERQEFLRVVENKELFINKHLTEDVPMMMGPIINGDQVVGIVAANKIGFENLTLYYENLFRVVLGLINSALSRAYKYQKAIYDEKFIERTNIMKKEVFNKALNHKIRSKQLFNIDFTILRLENTGMDIEELSHKVTNVIRDTDYLGVGEDDKLYVLLSNSSLEEAGIAIIRLAGAGISASTVKEVKNGV